MIRTIGHRLNISSQIPKTNKMPPWKYLLQHAPPPYFGSSLTSRSSIPPHNLHTFFNRLKKLSTYNDVDHEQYNRSLKVRVIILDKLKDENRFLFNEHMKEFLNDLMYVRFDYKFAQFYEDRIIIKLVQLCRFYAKKSRRNLEVVEYFIAFLISENKRLQDRLQKTINLDESHQRSVYNYYRNTKNSDKNSDIQRYTYPNKMFGFMERNASSNYSQFKSNKRLRNESISFVYQSNWIKIIEQNAQQVDFIVQKEKKYYENTKISRLDYLCGLQYILSVGRYNQQLIEQFKKYIHEDLKYQKQDDSQTMDRFLENMMICRILSNIESISKKANVNFKKIGQFSRFYIEKYIKYLYLIPEQQLLNLFLHESKLFPRQIFRTNDKISFKIILTQLIYKIFDFSSCGTLFFQSIDLNIIFQLILLEFSQDDQQFIHEIIKKYELLILNCGQPRSHNNQLAVFYVMNKYKYKSELINKKIQKVISTIFFYNQMQREKWSPHYQNMFKLYLNINLCENQSFLIIKNKKIFVQCFLGYRLWRDKKTFNSRRKKQIQKCKQFADIYGQSLQRCTIKQQFGLYHQNYRYAHGNNLFKYLLMMKKVEEIINQNQNFEEQWLLLRYQLKILLEGKSNGIKNNICFPLLLDLLADLVFKIGGDQEILIFKNLLQDILMTHEKQLYPEDEKAHNFALIKNTQQKHDNPYHFPYIGFVDQLRLSLEIEEDIYSPAYLDYQTNKSIRKYLSIIQQSYKQIWKNAKVDQKERHMMEDASSKQIEIIGASFDENFQTILQYIYDIRDKSLIKMKTFQNTQMKIVCSLKFSSIQSSEWIYSKLKQYASKSAQLQVQYKIDSNSKHKK